MQHGLGLPPDLRSNIDYVFINYFPLDLSIKNLHTFNYLDLTRYINIDGIHPLFGGFIDYIRDNKLNADKTSTI